MSAEWPTRQQLLIGRMANGRLNKKCTDCSLICHPIRQECPRCGGKLEQENT